MLNGNLELLIATFVAVSSVVVLLAIVLGSRERRLQSQLQEGQPGGGAHPGNSGRTTWSVVPRVGSMLMPDEESKRSGLVSRMQQAGMYRRHSTAIFLGVKFFLMVIPMLVGLLLAIAGMISVLNAVLIGAFVGLLGSAISSIWLRQLKGNRQTSVRRALPDALDIIVVCLEGGLSLPAALDRVGSELRNAYPLLSDEMAIVRREIQLGRTAGEALRQFADRFDLAELRSLASVVSQAERFGASIVKALRVHADTLRIKRWQYAEAQAQKAPVKLVFPTVLCIFPALYVVLMGPAGVQIMELLDNIGNR